MSDKIVMITDETDICYGMLDKVIAEGNGLHACYQLLITGYENCIKAGYSDKDITKTTILTNTVFSISLVKQTAEL